MVDKMAAESSGDNLNKGKASGDGKGGGVMTPASMNMDGSGGSGATRMDGMNGGNGKSVSGANGAGQWAQGGPQQIPSIGKAFRPIQPVFKNIAAPTKEEIEYFDKTRSYILITKSSHHSVDDILHLATYSNMDSLKGKIPGLIPQIFKTVPADVHMSYISVDKSIPDQSARIIIKQ